MSLPYLVVGSNPRIDWMKDHNTVQLLCSCVSYWLGVITLLPRRGFCLTYLCVGVSFVYLNRKTKRFLRVFANNTSTGHHTIYHTMTNHICPPLIANYPTHFYSMSSLCTTVYLPPLRHNRYFHHFTMTPTSPWHQLHWAFNIKRTRHHCTHVRMAPILPWCPLNQCIHSMMLSTTSWHQLYRGIHFMTTSTSPWHLLHDSIHFTVVPTSL